MRDRGFAEESIPALVSNLPKRGDGSWAKRVKKPGIKAYLRQTKPKSIIWVTRWVRFWADTGVGLGTWELAHHGYKKRECWALRLQATASRLGLGLFSGSSGYSTSRSCFKNMPGIAQVEEKQEPSLRSEFMKEIQPAGCSPQLKKTTLHKAQPCWSLKKKAYKKRKVPVCAVLICTGVPNTKQAQKYPFFTKSNLMHT